MPKTINKRMTADIEGDFVVFLVGMRINKFWKIHKWLPVARQMPKMLKELFANKELGLLGVQTAIFGLRTQGLLQYWRSFEHLDSYAKSRDNVHLPAWQKFNKLVASNGDVGIWHETYIVRQGEYETIYNNMPLFGLGRASSIVEATGRRESAAGRLGK